MNCKICNNKSYYNYQYINGLLYIDKSKCRRCITNFNILNKNILKRNFISFKKFYYKIKKIKNNKVIIIQKEIKKLHLIKKEKYKKVFNNNDILILIIKELFKLKDVKLNNIFKLKLLNKDFYNQIEHLNLIHKNKLLQINNLNIKEYTKINYLFRIKPIHQNLFNIKNNLVINFPKKLYKTKKLLLPINSLLVVGDYCEIDTAICIYKNINIWPTNLKNKIMIIIYFNNLSNKYIDLSWNNENYFSLAPNNKFYFRSYHKQNIFIKYNKILKILNLNSKYFPDTFQFNTKLKTYVQNIKLDLYIKNNEVINLINKN